MDVENRIPEFLCDILEKQYGAEILKTIIQGYKQDRMLTFRANTIKTTTNAVQDELLQAGIVFEKVPWYDQAFILNKEQDQYLRTLRVYEEGEIYLQSLSSMLPPIWLDPKPGESILDMAAAPGSKTTQIAALSQNKAPITACEKNAIRAERLKYNLQKQGVTSAYVMVTDARQLDNLFSFDKILLDAPCSGSGTIQEEDINLEKRFTKQLIDKSILVQFALLKKAINLLKPGGELIYSTCSILGCENEEVIKKALISTKTEIVPIDSEITRYLPLLPTTLQGTIAVCPNQWFEGFFIAKLRKY